MSERSPGGGGENFRRTPGASEGPKKNEKKIGRRNFLTGLMALGGAALVADRAGFIEKGVETYERYEMKQFKEAVEKEKGGVKKLIAEGVENAKKFNEIKLRYNKIVEAAQQFDEASEAYKKVTAELQPLDEELKQYYWERGWQSEAPFIEANPFAEQLLKDTAAVETLAAARVSYRENISAGSGNAELKYHHNCVRAYLDLGQQAPEQVKEKIEQLAEVVPDLGAVPEEKILYYLLDIGFDLSLTAEKLQTELSREIPGWDKYKATHENKDTYLHFNDLKVLDIFDLNRLRRVTMQLKSERFRATLFSLRDKDLEDPTTELGGVIPIPFEDKHIHNAPTEPHFNNDLYLPGPAQTMDALRGVAAFHFHATQMEEPPGVQGPSGADSEYFFPGVVFSSVNKDTILTHFFVSRALRGENFEPILRNDVVCLGEIHQNSTDATDKEP